MPEIDKSLSLVLTLQEKIPEIQNAGKQISMIDEDFASVESTMTQGIQEAKDGLQIINQVQKSMPDIQKLGQDADSLGTVTLDAAKKMQSALPSITNSVQITLQSIQEFSKNTSSVLAVIDQAIADNQLTDEEKEQINSLITNFINNIARQREAIQNIVDYMKQVQESNGSHDLDSTIEQLSNLDSLLSGLSTRMNHLNELVQNGDVSEIRAYLSQINDVVTKISNLVDNIDVSGISKTIDTVLTSLTKTITDAKGLLNQAQQIDFEALLNSTSQTVSNAVTILEKYQGEMPAIKQEIHDANLMLNGNMTTIVNAINEGASLYKNEFPILKTKLGTASDFFKNDYAVAAF